MAYTVTQDVATPPQIDQGAQALSLRTSPATRYEGMNSSIQQYILGAVARSFLTGGGGEEIASVEGNSLVGGSGGILPQKIFQFGGSVTLFLALVTRYVSEKSTSNINDKQLQVTIIIITEPKENKSINRLDLPGSTAPGGVAATPHLTVRTNWEPTYKTVSSCLKYCFNYQLEYEMKAISTTLQRARPSRDSYEHVIKVAVPSTVSRILKK